MATKIVSLAIPAVFWLATACGGNGPAWGDANSIIVLTTDSLWSEVGDTVRAAIERPVFTVRDEDKFKLTHVAPGAPTWDELQRFRQILLIGRAGDPWVAEVLEPMDGVPASLPALIEREDVWARGQRVTVLALAENGTADAVVGVLPELYELLDGRFRAYAQTRMFTSGPATELRDTLRATAGFALLVPRVYAHEARTDSVHAFRNDQAVGEQIDRTVVVAWRSGVPDTLTAQMALDWRNALARPAGPQVSRIESDAAPVEVPGGRGIEVRGVWSNPPGEWPAAGPFIDRMIVCPEQDRTYLLDAWLYVPGKGKYEYMIQMETILESFECGGPTD